MNATRKIILMLLPLWMLQEIQRDANTSGRDLSRCVQRAWLLAREELMRLQPGERHRRAEAIFQSHPREDAQHKLELSLPDAIHRELRAEAQRLDRSTSWLLQRAWCLAKSEPRPKPS